MSERSIERRAVKVASVTWLSSILTIGMQLVTVPICLQYWGKESYGTWLALFSVVALLQTTGTGFVNYVGNQLNLLYHKDQISLKVTLASSLVGILILAGIQLLLVVVIIGFNILPGLIGTAKSGLASQNANWSFLVLAGSWLLGRFYVGIIHRLLIPTGLMYEAAWWALASQLSLSITVIVSAFFRFTLLQTSVFFALIQSLFAFASASYIRFKLPQYYPWWQGSRFANGLRDLLRSIPLTVGGLLQQGTSSGLIILVSVVSGAAAVPVFTTVRTLTNLWTNITNVLTTPLLPDVVRFHAKGEGSKLLAVHEAHGVIVGATVNISILLAYPLVEPLYNYWTNKAVALERDLLTTLLASISLMNLGAMMNTFLTGINHQQSILYTTIVRSSVSLMFGGIMLTYFGIGGLGLAVLAGEFAALAFLIYFFNKTVRLHPDTHSVWGALSPAFLSVISVQVYLGMVATGISSTSMLYPIAIMVVLIGTLLGWRHLDAEIKIRLIQLLGKRFAMKNRV